MNCGLPLEKTANYFLAYKAEFFAIIEFFQLAEARGLIFFTIYIIYPKYSSKSPENPILHAITFHYTRIIILEF